MTAAAPGPLARLGPRTVVVLGVLAALLAFLPSLSGGFVFDDGELVTGNPFAHDVRYLGRCFTTDLWDTPARAVGDASPKFYRPVVSASYILDNALGHGAPWAYHLTNVMAHAAGTALAARVLLRWTASPLAALVATLVFAIHPSRSESVVWVSGRTDVFMTLGLLAALELSVSFARRARPGHLVLSFGAFALGLLSKELAVVFPLFLALEALLASGNPEHPRASARLAGAAGLFTLASLAYLVVRAHTLPIRPPEAEWMTLPPGLHAGYVLLSLGHYLERIVFPWPQTFYFQPVRFRGGLPILPAGSVLSGAAAVIAMAVAVATLGRKGRAPIALLLLFTATLLPALNLVDTGVPNTTADRFLYLPLLPLAACAARSTRKALGQWASHSRLAPIVVGASVLALSAVSWVRSLDYANDETMWRHELEVTPDNPMALGKLGQYLASHGDPDAAFDLLKQALTPAALRYQLLASPTRYYLGLLELSGPRLSDGDLPGLVSLVVEIESVLDGRVPDPRLRAGALDLPIPPADEHFRIHAANAAPHLAVAGALVASRLPYDDGVRRLAARVPEDAPLDAAARFNLALALGRASDYAGARAELLRASGSGAVEAAATGLYAALSAVEGLRAGARSLPEPASSLARAHALAELGAPLRAARVLRRALAEHPDDGEVRVAYFDALVSARLDDDAEVVARTMPGMDPHTRVERGRRQLPPRALRAAPPPPGTAWWAPVALRGR